MRDMASVAVNPGRVHQALTSYQLAQAVKGAIELDLFTHICAGAVTPAKIAPLCGGTEKGVRVLCDYLTVHGFLAKSGETYQYRGNTFPDFLKSQFNQPKKLGVPASRIHTRVEQLHEFNPMLGFRGCRLGIGYPEISAMQARAVFEAAAIVQAEGIKVHPEVMIPLVGFKKELDLQLEIVHRVAREVQSERKVKLDYLVGTMIEVPRGALTADEIAQSAEFFSFGTNDLTQTGLGMSRDDSGSFLPHYAELEIVKKNPFATIDQTGVGQLVEIAVKKGRATRAKLKLGICGEHGGDPASVVFFHKVGLDYVSCSPFRVPVARLAAAQAALQDGK